MELVGYLWIIAASIFVIASFAFALVLMWDAAMDRREARINRAVAKKNHPSRPHGPEDNPNWKEYADGV